MDLFVVLVAVAGGVIAGAFVAWLMLARLGVNGLSEQRIRDMFASLSQEALRANSSDFNERARREIEALTAPLKATLDEQQRKLEDLERERQKAYGSIEQQLHRMTQDQRLLQQETARLVSSLRQPQIRGRWGEIQLRRVVELAGMSEHCDFAEQESVSSGGKAQRPDLVVRLPNQRVIVVDAKAPLDAYLKAHECQDDGEAGKYLKEHADRIKNHIKEMGKRDYQSAIDGAFEFLVLFIPGEPFYRAALEHDPELIDFAFQHKVVLASPTTLIALLRTIAQGWREARLAENARKIRDEGEKVYRALSRVAEHVGNLGKALGGSVAKYNDLIGSLDRTLFQSAKRLRELDIGNDELQIPETIEDAPRSFSRPELLGASVNGNEGALPDMLNRHLSDASNETLNGRLPEGVPAQEAGQARPALRRLRPNGTGEMGHP
ncbi:MAG: DNA recombination protein RmuC [Oscillochloridaceae bacterium]|nr:DNA recombination protein RmuC [Chloroflexaceae bacterium]MDW8391397.1 DNA recombination protein RmuC [Oscillochloridaceae bacterium]